MNRLGPTTLLGYLPLFALIGAGCTAPIEGDILLGGAPLPGVEVTLCALGPTTAVTGEDGRYRFPPLLVGPEYTVTPSLDGFLFGPRQRTIVLPMGGLPDQDFVAVVDGIAAGAPWVLGDPLALVVTNEALAPAFRRLALLHTVTGVHTEVATVEEICAGNCNDADPRSDTARAIKDFLMSRPGLRYAILGGDIDLVPSRQVTASFTFTLTVLGVDLMVFDYPDQVFFSDYYYADFADWDPNGNGVYAEHSQEISDYRPDIAVSRLPASTVEDVEGYYEKLKRYLTETPPAAMGRAVHQAGVFTTFEHPFSGEDLEISAAYYGMDPGRSLDLLSSAYTVTRQFEAANPEPDPTAHIYHDAQEFARVHLELLEEGVQLVRYADHGTHTSLAPGIDNHMAYELENEALPVILSETCHGAAFDYEDSAGEQVVKAPRGGAIAYLGQGAVGNSLLGANQLLDEVTRYLVREKNPILGDAYAHAHEVLREVDDTFTFPLSLGGFPFFDVTRRVITEENRAYAQKSSVLLGDLLVPVWNAERGPAPELGIVRRETASGIVLTLTPSDLLSHAPTVFADGVFYRFPTVGTSFELVLDSDPEQFTIGFPSNRTRYFFREAIGEPLGRAGPANRRGHLETHITVR